jgi:hypothetical protein
MDRVEKARHARRLLEDPVLNEILVLMGEDVVDQWKHGGSPEIREQAYSRWEAQQEFLRHLRAMVDDGIMLERTARTRPAN